MGEENNPHARPTLATTSYTSLREAFFIHL